MGAERDPMAGSTGRWRYRVGLTFPGEMRDKFVKDIADSLVKYLQNDKKKVLYDHYHDEIFAKPRLDQDLPGHYRHCELVVVFLCEDYAQKHWTKLEWVVIRQLIQDLHAAQRVMLLWDGPPLSKPETWNTLGTLGLNTKSDGFLEISGMSPQVVYEKICMRLEYESECSPVGGAALHQAALWATADSVRPADNNLWRLMVSVGAAQQLSATGSPRVGFRVGSLLFRPDTQEVVSLSDQTSPASPADDSLPLEDLGDHLLDLFAEANNKIRTSFGFARPTMLVMLSLPQELLASGQWQPLLAELRATPLARRGQAPIALACLARQHPGKGRLARVWADAGSSAYDSSVELVATMARAGSTMADLDWLLVDGPSESPADAVCWAGQEFDELNEDDDRFGTLMSRHSVYFGSSHQDCSPERLRKVLLAGVPLFWLETPFAAGAGESGEHPCQQLLAGECEGFLERFCQFHAHPADVGKCDDDPNYRRQMEFFRKGYLFWDDHRFRPPDPSNPAAALKMDGVINAY